MIALMRSPPLSFKDLTAFALDAPVCAIINSMSLGEQAAEQHLRRNPSSWTGREGNHGCVMSTEVAVVALQDHASLWNTGENRASDVVNAACDALVATRHSWSSHPRRLHACRGGLRRPRSSGSTSRPRCATRTRHEPCCHTVFTAGCTGSVTGTSWKHRPRVRPLQQVVDSLIRPHRPGKPSETPASHRAEEGDHHALCRLQISQVPRND